MQNRLKPWIDRNLDAIIVASVAGLIVVAVVAAVVAVPKWMPKLMSNIVNMFGGKVSLVGSAGEVIRSQTFSVPLYLTSVVLLAAAMLCLVLWNKRQQRDIRRLHVQMMRFVLPRTLSEDEIKSIGQYLAANSQPHEIKIKYILGDRETQGYADDFSLALRAGNWLPVMSPINPARFTCQSISGDTPIVVCHSELQQVVNSLEGVHIQQTGPNPAQPSTIEEKLNPPKYLSHILSEALTAAGIQGISTNYGLNSDPLNTITIFVGSRPRDKLATIPPGFYERQKGILLHNITDDDF
jgi:hypothetical protein